MAWGTWQLPGDSDPLRFTPEPILTAAACPFGDRRPFHDPTALQQYGVRTADRKAVWFLRPTETTERLSGFFALWFLRPAKQAKQEAAKQDSSETRQPCVLLKQDSLAFSGEAKQDSLAFFLRSSSSALCDFGLVVSNRTGDVEVPWTSESGHWKPDRRFPK